MSPLLIGGLLAGGLIILVCVGFISHSLERNRLERARQVAELNARIKLSRQAMASVPGYNTSLWGCEEVGMANMSRLLDALTILGGNIKARAAGGPHARQ